MRAYKQQYIICIWEAIHSIRTPLVCDSDSGYNKVSPDMRFNLKTMFSLPVCIAFKIVEELDIFIHYLENTDTPTGRNVRKGFVASP